MAPAAKKSVRALPLGAWVERGLGQWAGSSGDRMMHACGHHRPSVLALVAGGLAARPWGQDSRGWGWHRVNREDRSCGVSLWWSVDGVGSVQSTARAGDRGLALSIFHVLPVY